MSMMGPLGAVALSVWRMEVADWVNVSSRDDACMASNRRMVIYRAMILRRLSNFQIIALLARRHRKKFPKLYHHSLHGFTKKVKQKFRILCVIIRVSALVQQYLSINSQVMEFSHSQEGFKLILDQVRDHYMLPSDAEVLAKDIEAELTEELELFRTVFQQKLIVVPSSTSKSSER